MSLAVLVCIVVVVSVILQGTAEACVNCLKIHSFSSVFKHQQWFLCSLRSTQMYQGFNVDASVCIHVHVDRQKVSKDPMWMLLYQHLSNALRMKCITEH